MRVPVHSGQFKSDLKAARKRAEDIEKIKKLMRLLTGEKPLPPQYKDHPLILHRLREMRTGAVKSVPGEDVFSRIWNKRRK